MVDLKFEILNSKHETNTNNQNPKNKTFRTLVIRILNLVRIWCFEFRICSDLIFDRIGDKPSDGYCKNLFKRNKGDALWIFP
ncbi:MAG: hypothetical protein A2Y79_08320 [Deltaproteobacteria bacterium RBG_13_43_22]|nr:MAG: hypothetical protein A2Y79_08320 [Deltaproteobacteria bacterium RBG_13_43_22]